MTVSVSLCDQDGSSYYADQQVRFHFGPEVRVERELCLKKHLYTERRWVGENLLYHESGKSTAWIVCSLFLIRCVENSNWLNHARVTSVGFCPVWHVHARVHLKHVRFVRWQIVFFFCSSQKEQGVLVRS